MEHLCSQDVPSIKTTVQQYLQNADTAGAGFDERSTLTQLCAECLLLFQIILKAFNANKSSWTEEQKTTQISLNRSFGRMKIWSDENEATDGTLDATLATCHDIHHDILKYILSIGQTLTERLLNVVDITIGDAGQESISLIKSLTAAIVEGESDCSSDSGFSNSSSDSVTGILDDLRMDTTCLMDLEPLLHSPISRIDPEPAAVVDTSRITWSPHQPYSDKVSTRFPQAADELVSRLGKANYDRYLRCQQQKASNALFDTQVWGTTSGLPEATGSIFHDSGIGSSLPTVASSYADTIMSYGMGEGRKVRVPPLPAPGKEGLAFECMACGKWVRINTNSAWKKHVYGDLRPWICLKEDCAVAIEAFRTREDWISHLALDHRMAPEWNLIECPLCRAEAGPGRFSITKHLSHHLEEISLAALPADCEFDEESEVSEPDSVNDNTEAQVRNAWLDGLMLFQAKTGRQIRSIPALTKRSLSLFEVRVAVQSQGGHEKVSEPNDWAHVCAELGLDDDEITHTAELLQSTYQYLVEPYESSKSVQEKDDEPSETEDQRQVTTSTGTTLKDPIQRAAGSQGSSSSVPNITDDSALSEIRDTEERDFLNTEALSTPVRERIPPRTIIDVNHTAMGPESNLSTSSRFREEEDEELESVLKMERHPAPFQCTLCLKQFTRPSILRVHLREHTDKPFVCTVCGVSIAKRYDSERHKRIHSAGNAYGEQPFFNQTS